MKLNESIVEDAALEWFGELGYSIGHGPQIAPGELAAERASFGDVVLVGRLRAAIGRLNPAMPEDEVAFYDALAANESAVIAAELITRRSVTIDWTLREGARAKIRVMVKRILNKYGYPPDLQDDAVKTVLAQAELLSAGWAEG